MNTTELKQRATELEEELQATANQSAEAAAFAAYEPLLSAISRAKAGEISKPEEIPGMYYWNFETGIFWKFKTLGVVFSRFERLLKGIEV